MKKIIQSILCLPLLSLGALLLPSCAPKTGAAFHTPIKTQSDVAPTKQETKWSRVNFGSYPCKEIVDSKWDGIDDYALLEGDILKDDTLYQTLNTSEWTEDKLTLNGTTYIREQEPGLDNREQHYRYDERPYHYFQVEPLRWRVIAQQDNVVTLLSDRSIDCAPFHEKYESVTWSTSSLRSWLNDEKDGFLANAFDEKESKALVKVTNENKPNLDYGASSGDATEDYVYILSNEEVFASDKGNQYGFYAGSGYDDPAKRFRSTPYAKYHGTWWSPVAPYKGNSFWFMRTTGYTQSNITYICDFGYIYHRGTAVNCDDSGILPVINVDMNQCNFDQCDEVSSLTIMRSNQGEGEENTCDPDAISKDETYVDFGRYPQSEVIPTAITGNDRGCIIDKVLFEKLQDADWDSPVYIEDEEYRKLDDRYFKVESIQWRVLSKNNGKTLLFPKYGLDVMPYHNKLSDANWEGSSIREWLNGDFFATAFRGQEDKVQVTEVENKKNFYFDTDCGSNTQDKVFLLSEEEIFCSKKASDYGFACSDADADPHRQIQPTRYALARGAWASEEDEKGFFMLRTNGYTATNAVYVNDDGNIYNRGIPVTCNDAIVMPACWVEL